MNPINIILSEWYKRQDSTMNCPRINQSCHNHELTIFDTNFFKNILNFYDDNTSRFNTFFLKVYDLLKVKCLNCAINNVTYITNKLARKELYPIEVSSLFSIATIFRRFNDKHHFDLVNCLFEKIVEIQTLSNATALVDLKDLANNWIEETRLGDIGERDLSLFLLALLFSNNQLNPVIIVTDDLPFYEFVNHYYNIGTITLNGTIFNSKKVCSISAVLYIYNLFNCCCFNEFEDFFCYMRDEFNVIVHGEKRDMKKDLLLDIIKISSKSRKHKIELNCKVI
ncbi:hypothetical protein LCGC14_1800090 [marine sediment metagenome]|uniref:PIN domain-containing protein n=1 Tax=marine sediment metagenome TaxID=412755 RepID=A0A0F9GQ13_9ZZZZ